MIHLRIFISILLAIAVVKYYMEDWRGWGDFLKGLSVRTLVFFALFEAGYWIWKI